MSDHPTVVELLLKVMDEVQAVSKKQRNTEQNYSFRGIDAVVNAVGPALRKHGVLPIPVLHKAGYRDVQTSRGKPSRECTVEVAYHFYGPAGDHIEAVVPGESMDFGDKGTAKAMSVAYRIALLQALCIPTDEPDADAQSYERAHEPDPSEVRDRQMRLAKKAIADAPDRETLESKVEPRIADAEDKGLISTTDAIELRRLKVARLDELFPAAQQPEGWPRVAEPGEGES